MELMEYLKSLTLAPIYNELSFNEYIFQSRLSFHLQFEIYVT